ncbi:PREDICTED: centromere protein K isoform X3 [Pseudopodoces humilis]|uniref:centromere protein K isoform X3 n=1 Tax=Pseudopodoces humilis TaxID=181119 RepID=UPI0006B6F341|nr:PREDICTED: centromere protein K isoform X3 [Pseudopodoces humilis]
MSRLTSSRRCAAGAECLSEITNTAGPVDAKEELLGECESIWKQMEECQSKLMLLGTETLLQSDAKLSLLMLRWKALTVDSRQWQVRNPEIISTNPDALLELGKEELQKVKNDLEMVLSAVRSKNKQLEEDLKSLKVREFNELKSKVLKLKTYKKKLLSALGEFLGEHFPLPEKDENIENKNPSSEKVVELITLQDILEMLINKLMTTPHEPYITINESFWPPYIELLLRCGMALRHPKDPNRMRLQAFHK